MQDTQLLLTQYPAFAALFAVVIITVLILIGLVITQNRQIQEMQRPKYGFLGKPLAAFAFAAFLVGGTGFVLFVNNQQQDVSVANADFVIDLNIISTQTNPVTNEYRFNAIPLVDGKEWGSSAAYKFDIYWTVSNSTTQTDVELGLNLNNKGGITQTLTQGTNRIKASVFSGSKSFDKEIDVYVD
ncbi:MAG: hypothetical protein ABI721_03180 [Candidatus Dojkabacteria bacterium]